jgi:hypothetical protein
MILEPLGYNPLRLTFPYVFLPFNSIQVALTEKGSVAMMKSNPYPRRIGISVKQGDEEIKKSSSLDFLSFPVLKAGFPCTVMSTRLLPCATYTYQKEVKVDPLGACLVFFV